MIIAAIIILAALAVFACISINLLQSRIDKLQERFDRLSDWLLYDEYHDE